MARSFNGNGDIQCSIGAFASAAGGNETYAFIARRAAGGTIDNLFTFLDSGGTWTGVAIQNVGGTDPAPLGYFVKNPGVSSVQSPTDLWDSSAGWCLYACNKASGNVAVRFHRYVYTTGTWIHENSAGTLADGTVTPGASGKVEFGALQGSVDFLDGDIAVAGAWLRSLSDTEIEQLPFTLAAWHSLRPDGLWLFHHANAFPNVIDLTGNGANLMTIINTSVSTSSVPTFSYGISPITVD